MKNYLIAHEQEAVDIMMALFDDDYIQETYGIEREQKGRKEGLIKGLKKGCMEGTALFASLMQNSSPTGACGCPFGVGGL